MKVLPTIKDAVFTKAFLIGCLLTCLIYGFLAVWALFGKTTELQSIERNLASQNVIIERPNGVISISESPEATDKTVDSPVEKNPEKQQTNKNESLPSTSVEGLFEQDANGNLLPIVRQSDGLTPFQAYKAPFANKNAPVIAIVIDDFGLSADYADDLIDNIPANSTILLSPYAQQAEQSKNLIRKHGHEFWVKVSFENKNFPFDDPGAKTILSRNTLGNNMSNLKWVLSRTTGYAGIASFIDNSFSGAKTVIRSVSREALNRGLGFLEMNISAPSLVKDIADPIKSPYIQNDLLFFDQKWNGQFKQGFELLETIAESRGYAVGVIKPYPAAIEALNLWHGNLAQTNITLAPLSAIAQLNGSQPSQ